MSNIEIERKYKITKELYVKILEDLDKDINNKKIELQNDIYFSPIHFPFFGGEIDNECLRLRILENKNILSYKKFIPKTATTLAHCIEHEIEITDIEKTKLILNDLRIEEVFTLKKKRIIFTNNGVEFSLDDVDNLGFFLELELINQDNLLEAEKEIEEFIKKFNITEEMRNYDGYSYLLFNQRDEKR